MFFLRFFLNAFCYDLAVQLRRMNKKLILGIGILAVVGFYLYNQVRRVSIGAATAMVHKLNKDGVELRIFLAVVNEANLTLDVQTFLGQIFYKGASMGIVQQTGKVNIPPLSVANIEMKTTISWTTLGFSAYDIFQQYQLNQNSTEPKPISSLIAWDQFVVRGTLMAEGLTIPINTTVFA